MQLHEILAISSLSGARMGIDGIVLIVLFGIGLALTIGFVGRHEYSPSIYGVFGVIAISLISAGIGGAIGQGGSSLAFGLIFCGVASLLTSGPLLDFRFPHRVALGCAAPIFLFLSGIAGTGIQYFILENALK
jgi:hypothetical protein